MEITGIIAEYNPFHNGHLYQINQIRQHRDSLIVAVISGSFTQRGEAAILDKWQRAQCAVESGCDLVLELPFAFACRSAQDFAQGGAALLARLGIVSQLAFGAESDNLAQLQAIASQLDDKDFQKQLHQQIANGLSYAQAISAVLGNDENTATLIRQPNNILAIEYLRSLNRLPTSIKPLLIPRQGAGYHEPDIHGPLASATAIRQALYQETVADLASVLPAATYQATRQLSASQLPDMNRLYLPLQTKLLTSSFSSLQNIYGINEGLENRILDMAQKASDWQKLIKAVTTKRYPASRIARTLLYLLLDIDKGSMALFDQAGPLYARLLAASSQGKKLLKDIKQQSSIPLITKTSQYLNTNKRRGAKADLTPFEQMLSLDTIATELRNLTCQTAADRNDFQQSPVFSNR
ncbi:cytidyltransferase-like domain-containing protein [Selenomonas ruminantium]|uniref:tRNA(Met) cytidine acetate ligase n=1 Tax=Selenomonas ruminantium TaxID=971 RepID=A0A1M6U1V7_SELRU|nr:nucleotidyltransferase [Selenomonas ruminantium]SHK63130.1 cytidyltransferase-like domain-containing protein [Selenomonas ruminantium]